MDRLQINTPGYDDLIKHLANDIRSILENARAASAEAINKAMIGAYWKIGQRIVEEEQSGNIRAAYGEKTLFRLAQTLSDTLGGGFSERNLRNYRQFYLTFKEEEIWNTRVPNLTWSHFRAIMREPSSEARQWYMNEASGQMWSARTLSRNIGSQYYHRLPASHHSKAVKEEMEALTSGEYYIPPTASQFIKSH